MAQGVASLTVGEPIEGQLVHVALQAPAGKHTWRQRECQARAAAQLVDWRAAEVFRDSKLGASDYSLLVSTTFQAPDRTLREEELQSFQSRVIEAVSKAGAKLRT